MIDVEATENKEKKEEKPKIENQAPAPERELSFDDIITEMDLDKKKVEEYIETVAKSVNCSVDYVKEKAFKKMDSFVEKFKQWEAKNKPTTPSPKPKKAKPEKKAQPAQWLVELEEQLSNYDPELVNEVLKENGYNSIYDIPNEETATEIYLTIDTKAKELKELF